MKTYKIYFTDRFVACDVERFKCILNKVYPSLEAKMLSPSEKNQQHYLWIRTSSIEIINSLKLLANKEGFEIKEIKTLSQLTPIQDSSL